MINNFFEEFCSNIKISESERNKITYTKEKITNCIFKYYDSPTSISESQYIGAYGRNTAVYIENIRLLCVLPSNLYFKLTVDIEEILNDMIEALIKEFPTCERNYLHDGLIINIDGVLSFKIIPGFVFDNGEYLYLMNNAWQELHLKTEKEMFNKLNVKYNNNVVDLCRILKVWKVYNNIDISNILLDTFAYHFFNIKVNEAYTINSYDHMLADFFKFLLPNCKSNNYISFDSKTILRRNEEIYDKVFFSMRTAETAIVSAECGLKEEAIIDWKRVLGSYFIK